jgi:myo-inositol-1(or 4)-monophosphatase
MMRAAEKAARSLVRDFGEVENLQVSRKGPADFVSAADRRAEDILHELLLHDRPDYAFLMEESGVKGRDDYQYRWIIDPLDGTTNFLHGIPHWCISIALEEKKGGKSEIIAGLIADPIKDEWFTAEKGGGSFSKRKRLRVSGRTDIDTCLIAGGAPFAGKKDIPTYQKEVLPVYLQTSGFRRIGSAALDMAYVAAGRFDGYWERGIHPWDVAAGLIIVREAGGFAEPVVRGQEAIYGDGIIAGNQGIREFLMKIPQ